MNPETLTSKGVEPDRLSPENPGPMMPLGPMRMLYIAMLDKLPMPAIRDFWRAHPLIRKGRAVPEPDVYRLLWENQEGVSAYEAEAVYFALEPFLHARNLFMSEVLTEKAMRQNQGGAWRAEKSLQWMKQFLPALFAASDPRVMLLEAMNGFVQGTFPGSWCSTAGYRQGTEWNEAVHLWAPDQEFRFRFLFPIEFFSLPMIRAWPCLFGLPPYEEIRLLADSRHPSQLLWSEACEVRGNRFYIGTKCHGRLLSFHQWAREQELDFQGRTLPDSEIILMEEEYRCPKRRRVVLFRGCVYNAFLYLALTRFRPGSSLGRDHQPENYLNNILAGLNQKDDDADLKVLESVHLQLIEAATAKLAFEYRADSQALLLDGKVLLSGVPALILRKILRGHAQGQTGFDHRAFKYDTEIFASSKGTNFIVRLGRIQERLEKTTGLARIEKTGEGAFAFRADCPVEFQDAA